VTVDKNHGRIGIDIVVRDYEGIILAALCTTRNVVANPVVAKALAALHAVKLSRELSFNDIILEWDALHIVTVIKAEGNNLSKVGHIVDGIKKDLR
jgi:hypothetical protein